MVSQYIKKNILKSFIKDKDIFAFYDIEGLLDDTDFAEGISAGIDIQGLTDILLGLEREQFEDKEVFSCLLDEYISKAEEYLNSYDLIDSVEDLIDDAVEVPINRQKMMITRHTREY